ncbi:MAG: hypothetical protein ACLFU4_10275 [Opitutales bacterium]
MERTLEGVRIHAPHGEVLLRASGDGIKASYESGRLVQAAADAYAVQVAQVALAYAKRRQLPWSTDAAGHIVIHDAQRYYEDSFCPELQAVETLLRWDSSQR